MTKVSPIAAVARRIALSYARASRVLARVDEASRGAVAGLVTEALGPAELSRLTASFYQSLGVDEHMGVSREEAEWFEENLPPPPSRVFLGGAGRGRELRWLEELGYQVDAIEPVESPEARTSTVIHASYEDLSAAVLDGAHNPIRSLSSRPYDAVVLGFGSVVHVLTDEERTRLFAALDALCPSGPILASFFLASMPTTPGRAERAARAVGRRIRGVRGLPGDGRDLTFGAWFGVGRVFKREEIEALAGSIGREVRWAAGTGARATLKPIRRRKPA